VRWESAVGELGEDVGLIQLLTNDEQQVIVKSRARYSELESDPFYQPSSGDKGKSVPGPGRAVFYRDDLFDQRL
jgi:hypothetical protein